MTTMAFMSALHCILLTFCWIVGGRACVPPEFTLHSDRLRVTPNNIHISEGDQAIVQCEVEYPVEDQPPQSHIYINDCKMQGYNHPPWIMRIMESDGACVHNANSETTLCRTHTVYINGTAEAHNSRIYCCARLGSRVCTNSSKITIVVKTQYEHLETTTIPTPVTSTRVAQRTSTLSVPTTTNLTPTPTTTAVSTTTSTSTSSTTPATSSSTTSTTSTTATVSTTTASTSSTTSATDVELSSLSPPSLIANNAPQMVFSSPVILAILFIHSLL